MRRIVLFFLAILYFTAVSAQVETTITVPYTTSTSPTYQALLYLPSDYSTSGKSYPLLVFCHSASEAADGSSAGTGLAKIYNQAQKGGPAYYIEHGGWPATFTNPITGAQEQFIVVSPQSNDWSINGDQLANIVNYLVGKYRVDINRIHLTGVSAGAQGVEEYAAQLDPNEDAPSLSKDVRKYKPADIVPMSAATGVDPNATWAGIDVADSIPFWGFGDPRNDLYGGYEQDFYNAINKIKSGYAHFTTFNTGHGPWNPFYVPTYTESFTWKNVKSNYNIYTWMLANSRVAVPVNPVANAGTAQTITLPTSQVTLNGSGSTGTITSYTWTQVSGPSTATLTTPGAVSTNATGLVQGVYVFRLAVTGGSTATVQVTVNAAPPPPVANAGTAQTITLPTGQATLSGSASTGTITSYSWTQVSGPSTATIATPTAVSTKVSALIQGVYIFELTVTGGSTATVQVTVVQPPLVANAGAAQTITLPTSRVTLTASASTGNIVSYVWSQLIGPTSDTIATPGAASTVVNGLVSGNYTFQLKITDNTGIVSTSTVDITVLSNTAYASPVSSIGTVSQRMTLPVNSVNETVNYRLTGSSLASIKWTKFKTPGQTAKTVVFLGSSTTAGVGASIPDSSFVGRFTKYYTAQGIVSNVVTLAVAGYNPYNAMPTGYTAPASVINALGASTAAVDPSVNITRALSYNPDIVVINFPNNGYDVLSTADIMNGLQQLYNYAGANGAQVYISTTQPREDFSTSIQSFLKVLRDSILLRFGSHAMNFYDPITVPGTTKRLYPSSADNIHDNDQGHLQLFNVVAGTNIFQNTISSSAVIANSAAATASVSSLPVGINLFQATVIDTHGQNTSAVATVTVDSTSPPVANAGSAQTVTLPNGQLVLNGSASTGTITSYLWTELSGPDSATILTPTAVSSQVTGYIPGVYVFQLTLNGDSTATVQVTVNPPPPPVANAGPAQTITLPANQVVLSGGASSGTITSYAWSKLSGPDTATIVSPAADTTMVTGLVQGVYVFALTLNGDTTFTSTVQVTVNPPPPPLVNAGAAQTITLPVSKVLLDGSKSTGTIASYAWSELSGPDTATIVSPASDTTTVTGLVQGVYVFALTVNGDSTATVQITVNQPPLVANAGPSQTVILPVSQALLSGTASSGIIASYNWSEISGPSSATITTPSDDSTIVSGLVQGAYVFRLTVADNLDTVRTDTMVVNVINGTVSKQINVQVYGGTNPYTNSQWNNWNVSSQFTSAALKYSDGTASTVTASLSINESVVDNGATYGGTMAPPAVLRYTSYCEVTRTLTLSNLKATATYNLELYASRNSNSGQLSVFKAGTTSDTISSYNNLTKKALFSGLSASAGKLVITIATPTGYNYLNGFAITEITQTMSTGGTAGTAITGAGAGGFADSAGVSGAGLGDLVIYPNPAKDQFTLNLNNSHTGAMKIMLVNGAGVNVLNYETYKSQQTSTTLVPVGTLPVGVYFVIVQVGNWRESTRMVKL